MGPMGHPFLEVGTEFHSASGHKGRVQGAGKGSKRDSGGIPCSSVPSAAVQTPQGGELCRPLFRPHVSPRLVLWPRELKALIR